MRVATYWNLHRKLWSVVATEGENKGRVIFHTPELYLNDVSFVVRKSGRNRVLREGKKNVHAFAKGTITPTGSYVESKLPSFRITYNPYKSDSFYFADYGPGSPIRKASNIKLTSDGKLYLTY